MLTKPLGFDYFAYMRTKLNVCPGPWAHGGMLRINRFSGLYYQITYEKPDDVRKQFSETIKISRISNACPKFLGKIK